MSSALLAAVIVTIGCTTPSFPTWTATAKGGMVASPCPYASQAGAEILAQGGNAIDAAIATSLALAVTRPYSTGPGGGGFALIWQNEPTASAPSVASSLRRSVASAAILDFREIAPSAATPEMFKSAKRTQTSPPATAQPASVPPFKGGTTGGLISASSAGAKRTQIPPSRYGGLAVATPGLVAGYQAALHRFGTRSLAELVQPARRLATNGFRIDRSFADHLNQLDQRLTAMPQLARQAASLRETFFPGGHIPAVGDTIRRPKLALLFDTLADGGADGFYHGPVADDIVRAVQSAGGIMTRDDLARYKPVWREPLRVPYRGRYTWLLMPPPSSGGVVIGQVLRFLEPTDMTTLRRDDPAAAAHWLVEAMKHAYANRARWLGDPAFVHNPVAMMLDPTYAAVLAERSQWDHTLPPEAYGTTVLPPDAGTAHICVVDAAGNVVSWTETINTSFGALNETPKYGVVLNNEMDDFTAEPGKPNAFGLIQSARNAPAPGKRPLSSMSPTIILRDGKPWLVLGAAGGPRIISSVLNVGLHCIDGAQSLPDAMTAVRLHHQWMPDEIVPSAPLAKPIADALRRRGHTIAREPGSGHVQAIAIENGELIGVSDPNKGGGPVGAK